MNYKEFIKSKHKRNKSHGFKPVWIPDVLFDFQKYLTDWSIINGRSAVYADCGLGKTAIQLTWAENVVRHTGGNVIILTPLAVAPQTVNEGVKFGVDVKITKNGVVHKGVNVTNYHRLHHYNPKDFVGLVCDESGILKNFDGKYRKDITEFLHKVNYRLLCTATPAPNDYMELGTSSEALGTMGRNQMLGMFFTNDGESTQQWRLKGHAKKRFWQWVSTWARAVRTPSDIGFSDDKYILPSLRINTHVVKSPHREGFFHKIAGTLSERRKAKRDSLIQRCEKVKEIVPSDRQCVIWCQLNTEGDQLERIIPDAVQVSGSQSDDVKERKLNDFSKGNIRVLVTKPSIACFGLNWQNCADVVYFPSDSYEQYYQAIRRCYRFGQTREVNCHLVYSESESVIAVNMLRKERQSQELYAGIVKEMQNILNRNGSVEDLQKIRIPNWLVKR